MRRILIFSLVYYPHFVGGAEVAVKEITDRISPGDFEFEMITINGGGEDPVGRYSNIKIHRLFNKFGIVEKFLYPFAAYKKAIELHRQNPYNLIWPIMASYAGFAAFLFKRKYPQVPSVLTIQEGDHFERRAGIFNPFFRWIFQSTDHLQAISNFLAGWSRKMGATATISVVPNAVDIDLFARISDAGRIAKLKNELGKKEADIFLITTSRLVEKNAVGDVIDSLKYLPTNVKLLILGSGHLEGALKRQASELEAGGDNRLSPRVHFLGFVPHTEMPAYLHVSDIFIRPSLSEGLGNSFLEAMAAGLPVIATPVGGIPDFLIDGETGLFCEVNNPRSIAQKVEKLMKDKESRDYIVQNARKMVEERYTWEKIALKMKEIFGSHI